MARPGGTVSAIACFCHLAGLPDCYGRYPLPGNHRIDELDLKLRHVWTRAVRPRLTGVDHSIPNLDLLWQFKAAGFQDIQINGHLELFSPGDERVPLDEATAYALASYERSLVRLTRRRKEHGKELGAAGFSEAEFEELISLKRARYEYLQENPACVREVMEVVANPLLIVRGTRPLSSDN